MIIYNIIKFLLSMAMPFFNPLLAIADVVFLWDWVPGLIELLKIGFYLIPVFDLLPLIRLIFLVSIFRIMVSMIRFICDIIPMY